jgi:NAD(P)H-dependent FMN reductase
MPPSYSILAISGSLRAQSSNTELLRAAALVAPPSVRVTLFGGLATLPHFNPDLDGDGANVPASVRAFREDIERADALLICSPEYAHGVPGVLKNALDWLVSGHEIPFKPIGLLNASSRSTHAYASLAETLRTMSTVLVTEAALTLPLDGRRLNASAIAHTRELAEPLGLAVAALVAAVDAYRKRRADLLGAPAAQAPRSAGGSAQ